MFLFEWRHDEQWASACNRQMSGRFPAQRVYEQRTQRTGMLCSKVAKAHCAVLQA